MNAERNPVRRLVAALMLALVLATPGALAHADTLEAGRRNSGAGFMVDGAWAAATCGFAMALTRFDPGFSGSAALICMYAHSLDD